MNFMQWLGFKHSKKEANQKATTGGLPSPPPAQDSYVLFSCGDGFYDIEDAGQLVGSVCRVMNGRDKEWRVTVYGVNTSFWSFDRLRDWLGYPKTKTR